MLPAPSAVLLSTFTWGQHPASIRKARFRASEASVPVVRNAKAHYPPTLTMVKEALAVLDELKGVSVVAIKRYILHNYPGVNPIRLKYYLKQALAKGLEKGDLIRPLHSSAHGATGRFKLAAGKPRRVKGQEEKSPPPGGESSPSPEKKAVKKPKAKAPSEKGKKAKAKAKAKAEKPRDKVGDQGEKKAAARKKPKATPGQGPAGAPAKAKEKASQREITAKASAPKASGAKVAAAAVAAAVAAPKELLPKEAKTARRRQEPHKAEADAQPPLAGKAKVTVAAKEAKAKAGVSKAKTGGGASKPATKKGVASDKGKKLAGPEGS